MGKLTVAEAEELSSSGVLSKSAVEEMRTLGLVSNKRKGVRKYMKTDTGTWVSPQLYFQGLGKTGTYSKKMVDFRTEFNTLVNKYASNTKNGTKNGTK